MGRRETSSKTENTNEDTSSTEMTHRGTGMKKPSKRNERVCVFVRERERERDKRDSL